MNNRETVNLEHKINASSDSFLKTISAYANYGKGTVVFGIDDTGKVVGVNDPVKVCLTIENKINDTLKPIPKYSLDIKENKTIVLEVSEGIHKPYLYKNKAYKRADSSTIEVDRIEFTRLVLYGSNQNFDELPANSQELTFNSLNKKLIEKLKIDKLNIDILKTLNIYSEHMGYNRAAELLADKNNYPGIDIVRFGNNINEFLDRETYQGMSLIDLYDKTMDMFNKYYKYEVIEGSERKEIELIPEEAFREALANGIVHRTWDIQAPIRISMFKDKIEIISPGSLTTGISKEEFLNGQISIFRNPIIGNIFYRLKYIEMFGTGIRRIKYVYEDSIIKPEFNISENSIVITLPLISKDLNILDKDEQEVFNILKPGSSLTRLGIEKESNFNKDKTIRILNSLLEKRTIEKIGQGRGTKYRRL